MRNIVIATAAVSGLLLSSSASYAQEEKDASRAELEQRVEQLEQELGDLKAKLSESTDKETAAASDAAEAVEVEATSPPTVGPTYRPASHLHNVYWHLAGYGVAGLILSDNNAEGAKDTFAAGHFSPDFHFQYKDLVLFESEVEFAITDDAETEIELEYSQFDIFLHDYVTLVVGKFLSPVGQFQERLHPAWINKIGNKPAGFGHDGAEPEGDVGVQLRGGVPLGGGATFTYALAAGNGPRLGDEGGNIEFDAYGVDDNANKAFSGRIAILPVPYFEVGGSFLTAKVDGLESELPGPDPTDADVSLWGADAAFTLGPWDARFEYLHVTRDPIFSATEDNPVVSLLEKVRQRAWYAQVAYRLSGLTDRPVLSNFEPVVRYGEYNIKGLDELSEELSERRFNFGLNYWLAPSIVARGGVEWRKFTERPGEPTDTRYLFQFSHGF